jgi:tetratricopeptide (TPR) repeat protein
MMQNRRNHTFSLGTALIAFLFFTIVTFMRGVAPCHAAEELYESRLDEGLSTTEPYSYLLITLAHQNRAQAKELIEKARRYSPDLPAVYFEMAKEGFILSPNGILQGLDYFREGIKAYGRNFWWAFSLAGLTSMSLFLSFFLSLLVVLIIRSPVDAGLIVHEGREEKKRLLLFLIPLGLSLLGPVALAAGTFFLFGLYFKKENKALVYASLLFLAASSFLVNELSPFLSSPASLKAIVAVNERKDNRYALLVLKGRNDFPSAFSYALALKREGHYQEAIEAYKDLAGRMSRPDPRVLINLGNANYGIRDMEAAKEAYQQSIGITPLPSAYYNFSQLYRDMLDFTKGDEYFQRAASLSPEAVTRFTSIAGTNPNRFVVDETLPFSALWEYARKSRSISLSVLDMPVLFLAVAMIPGFYFLTKKLKYRAQRCKRCGAVFCSRCSRTMTWGEMCSRCFSSLVKIDEMDSRERVARLLSIYQIRSRRRNTVKLISYMIPGGGQIFSGKILAGFLFLWVFLFCLVLLLMNSLLPESGVLPFSHSWITPLMVIFMMVSYSGAILHIRRRIHKGWL